MEHNNTEFSDDYVNMVDTASRTKIDSSLETLLKNRPDIINIRGYKNRTPLMVVCGAWPWKCGDHTPSHDENASKILIDAGADIHLTDDDGCTALYYALTYGLMHINNFIKAGMSLDETLHKMIYMMKNYRMGAHPMDVHERLLEYAKELDDENDDESDDKCNECDHKCKKTAEQYRNIAKYIEQWFNKQISEK